MPSRLSFAALCLLLIAAPYYLSGVIYPASGPELDAMAGEAYLPLAVFLSLSACICLLMALSGKTTATSSKDDSHSRLHQLMPWLLAAFFAWVCLAAVTTVHLHETLLELSRVGGCIGWFFIARKLLDGFDQKLIAMRQLWIFSAITGGAVLVAAIAVVNYFSTRGAQFSTFYNPNLFANYCAMAIPVALGWAILASRAVKSRRPELAFPLIALPTLLPSVLILVGLLASSSKGGLLSFIVAFLVFVIAVWRAQSGKVVALLRTHALVVGSGVLLLLLGGGFVFSKTVLPRLQEASSLNDHSTMFRVYTWHGTLHMAQARPLLGWGAGSFPAAYSQFAIAGPTGTAHQLWLQLAAENGFPALLLLAAAWITAVVAFWKALRSENWPVAATGLGALTAFAVHGLTDAGWSMISIAVLLMTLLALSSTLHKQEEVPSAPSSVLDWPWLVAALIFAIAGAGVQRAVRSEDLQAEAVDYAKRGAAQTAWDKALEATEVNPLSSRAWINLALFQAANGQDATTAFERALALQPTRPATHLSMANYLASLPQPNQKLIELRYDRAVELDPNNSTIRLKRAQWRLDHNDARGWDDLEYVARLADEPYGKYPATPQFVNLDFARAYIRLVPRLLQKGDGASREKAKAMVQRGLADVQRAHTYEAEQKQYAELMQATNTADDAQTLSEIESQLNQLARQAGVKTMEDKS